MQEEYFRRYVQRSGRAHAADRVPLNRRAVSLKMRRTSRVPLERGETEMQRLVLACAAFMALATPLKAQQAPDPTTPEQTLPPPQPPVSSQPAPDALPPFIPPPRARLYDSYRPAAHHHARQHHRRAVHRHVSRHRRVAIRHRAAQHHRVVHASRLTIRRCHSMTYKQIMRHGSCRALMRQELSAPKHVRHHARHHVRHHRSRHHRHR